jgi:hypothetical protein
VNAACIHRVEVTLPLIGLTFDAVPVRGATFYRSINRGPFSKQLTYHKARRAGRSARYARITTTGRELLARFYPDDIAVLDRYDCSLR